ncbi:MAG: orotate phosphoribosyltransferase [Chloroflexota bacterium]
MTDIDRATLARALVEAAYLRGHFVLRSGKTSNYYFDKYLFETRPDLLGGVANLMAQMLPPNVDRLAGPELGAVALAAAVSLASGVPFVIVRKEQKDYGTNKAIEGILNAGERVVLLEDVLTTAGEALRSAQVLTAAGAQVVSIIGVVDREEGAAANAAAAGFALQSVFRRSELETYLQS